MANVTIIRNGLVLTQPGAAPSLLDLVLHDDTLHGLTPAGAATDQNAVVYDASGRLIMPGLVNAHTHSHGGLAKGLGDRWSLELLLNAGSWMNGGRTEDDLYVSAVVSAVENLRKGCTACYDLVAMMPAPTASGLQTVAQAYADVGLRAVVAPMLADTPFHHAIPGLMEAFAGEQGAQVRAMRLPPGDAALSALTDAERSWPFPRDRQRLGIAPTIPLHCSDTFLMACRDLSERFGLPLQTHLAESPVQRAAAIRRYGMPLTHHLHRLGLLSGRFSAAHAIWIDASEIALLHETGGAIAHNPGSNLRLGNGIADMRPVIDGGVRAGVGTDGSGSSDNQNMFEAMRLAAYVSRMFERPPERWIGAADALALATEGSAGVLGLPARVGRIAPGFQADLVFLDLDHVNLVPLNDATQQLVNTEDGAAVRDVMVAGRWALRDGRPVLIDWPAIAVRARAAAERLLRANTPARALAEALAPTVSQFCAGLGQSAERGLARKLPA